MKPAGPRRSRPRDYRKGGYFGAKATLKRGGIAGLDQRTAVARALAESRGELVDHLGGVGVVSVTEDRSIEGLLYLDELIAQGAKHVHETGAIDRRRHGYRAVAKELAGLIEKRQRILADLGWKPRAKEGPSLRSVLAAEGSVVPRPDAIAAQPAPRPFPVPIAAQRGGSEAGAPSDDHEPEGAA